MSSAGGGRDVSVLGAKQLAFYRAHGYLIAPQLASEAFLVGVQALLELLVEDTITGWRRAGILRERFSDLPFESRYHRAWIAAGRPERADTARDERFSPDALATHVATDELAAMAAEVIGVDAVAMLASSFYRARFPGDPGSSIPWHQDAPCMKWISPVPFVTVWIPLVDVSSVSSCLEVSPVGPDQRELDSVWSERSGYVCMRESDVDALASRRSMTMCRGDVLLMSPYLPHHPLANTGSTIRWSIDLRFAPT